MKQRVRRWWFYFRTGNSGYLSLVVGLANFAVIQYVLFLQRFAFLKSLSFSVFALMLLSVYGAIGVVAGYFHVRSLSMRTDTDIAVIQNPYTFRITPGKEREIQIPLTILNLEATVATLEALGRMTPEKMAKFDLIRQRLEKLMSGEEIR